jgi:hypothetical protein
MYEKIRSRKSVPTLYEETLIVRPASRALAAARTDPAHHASLTM